MQRQENHTRKKLIYSSVIVAVVAYFMRLATQGVNAPFRISAPAEASSVFLLLINIMPLFILILVVSASAYILLRRKIAVAAAASTGFLTLGFYDGVMLINSSMWKIVTAVIVGIAGAGIFYGFYNLLARVKRPKSMGILLVIGSCFASIIMSLIAYYILRVSFTP